VDHSRGTQPNQWRSIILQTETLTIVGKETLDPFLVETKRFVGIRVAAITVDFVLRVVEPGAKTTRVGTLYNSDG